MRQISFSDIIAQAWNAALPQALPWTFGILLAGASVTENFLSQTAADISSLENLSGFLRSADMMMWLAIGSAFFLLFVVNVLGKSNLIAALAPLAKKPHSPHYPCTLTSIVKNFSRAFLLETIVLLFTLAVAGILALPLFIASKNNPSAISLLTGLGLLTFVPIAIIAFFIRQYALLYLMFSPLGLRAAIEVAGTLFSRFLSQSLLFGLFSVAVTILFTFCLNLAILSTVVLSEKVFLPLSEALLSIIFGLVACMWFAVFHNALWVAFFASIAGPDKTAVATEEEKKILLNDGSPEIPPA